jgi:hypothetical protein
MHYLPRVCLRIWSSGSFATLLLILLAQFSRLFVFVAFALLRTVAVLLFAHVILLPLFVLFLSNAVFASLLGGGLCSDI